jgi:hypothetical protein
MELPMMKNKNHENIIYECVVQDIRKGPHGWYAIATCNEINGSITFSCAPPVWKEDHQPTSGEIVLLSDVYQKQRGWRAGKAVAKKPDVADETVELIAVS